MLNQAETPKPLSLTERLNAWMAKMQKPGLEQKTTFFRLMAVSQKAGLGIRQSLISLLQGQENKGMLIILEDMIHNLTVGMSLAEAMSKHEHFFVSDEVELVRSTEITGNMAEVLEEAADNLEANQAVKAKVKKALTYPILVIVFAILAVVILLIFVMPAIIKMYGDIPLPMITQVMIKVSNFLKYHWYWLLIGITGAIIAYKVAYKTILLFKIMIDALLLKLPIIKKVVKLFYMYRFTTLLSQFYQAGVSPVISFDLLARIFKNFHYKKKMVEVKNSMVAGFSIFESLEGSELFDPILIQIINVGENTGTLASVLKVISRYYLMSLNTAIDSLMALIEPLLMAFVACIVGVLLGAIYLPMADMINVITTAK